MLAISRIMSFGGFRVSSKMKDTTGICVDTSTGELGATSELAKEANTSPDCVTDYDYFSSSGNTSFNSDDSFDYKISNLLSPTLTDTLTLTEAEAKILSDRTASMSLVDGATTINALVVAKPEPNTNSSFLALAADLDSDECDNEVSFFFDDRKEYDGRTGSPKRSRSHSSCSFDDDDDDYDGRFNSSFIEHTYLRELALMPMDEGENPVTTSTAPIFKKTKYESYGDGNCCCSDPITDADNGNCSDDEICHILEYAQNNCIPEVEVLVDGRCNNQFMFAFDYRSSHGFISLTSR